MSTAVTSLTVKSQPQFVQPNGNTLYPRSLVDTFPSGLTFTSGVTANKIDRLVIQQFVLAASGTLTIDLQAGTYSGAGSGSLLDLNNEAVTFARLKFVLVRLIDAAGKSTSVLVDNTVLHAFPAIGGNAVAAGSGSGFEGPLAWCNPSAAGEVVTNGSSDIFTVTNEDASNGCTVELILGGCAS